MADATEVYRAHPTPEEIAEVLGKRVAAAVGTHNPDGSIHLAYVLFLHEEGRMHVETSSVTRKARNAAARGWASMLLQGRASTGRNLMVAAEGTARVLHGPEAAGRNRRLRAKYIKPEALDGGHAAAVAVVDRLGPALRDAQGADRDVRGRLDRGLILN